jgi:hypothetical protein
MIRSMLSTFTKQTMGRVRRRTSTKQRSMTLVVRSFGHKCRGKAKNDSSSGKSRCRRRTMGPYSPCQRAESGERLLPRGHDFRPNKSPAPLSSPSRVCARAPKYCASCAPSNVDAALADRPVGIAAASPGQPSVTIKPSCWPSNPRRSSAGQEVYVVAGISA